MNCRRALKQDYETLAEWWKSHGWPAVQEEILPFGLVAEKDGTPKAAAFLYMASNAPVAYLEYAVTNPENSVKESYEALSNLFEQMTTICRHNMILTCFARVSQDSLARLYEKHGFQICDTVKDLIWTWRA